MDDNPYRPPEFINEPVAYQPAADLPLATLGQRFTASVLDSLIVYGPFIIICIWAPIPFLNYLWLDEGPLAEALFGVIGFLLFLAINGQFIHTRDQTLGKAALRIKVTKLNGKSPSTLNQFGLRYGSLSLIGLIPTVGPFISFIGILFIFGAQRRCLHDYLAGTRVVQIR